MNNQLRIYRKLPDIIKSVLLTSEGWLVGSTIKKILEEKDINDYDIIVPNRELFQIVIKQLSSNLTFEHYINSFGGFKFQRDDVIIDIWCEELDHFLKTANKYDFLFNMKRNILLSTEK